MMYASQYGDIQPICTDRTCEVIIGHVKVDNFTMLFPLTVQIFVTWLIIVEINRDD